MKPEQQRIAIAEACGWKRGTVEEQSFSDPTKTIKNERWISPTGWPSRGLPDYPNDLNAMHEAESSLPSDKQTLFAYELMDLLGIDPDAPADYECVWILVHATAAQRAEAFLRTINKWEDE